MSSSYADRKVIEALAEAGGSPAAARRILLGWIARDDRLLRELAEPFMPGIVGQAVERAVRAQPKPKPAAAAKPLAASALDGLIRALGENFARSGGSPTPAGMRAAASPEHAETIRGLAKAHVSKRGPVQLSSASR